MVSFQESPERYDTVLASKDLDMKITKLISSTGVVKRLDEIIGLSKQYLSKVCLFIATSTHFSFLVIVAVEGSPKSTLMVSRWADNKGFAFCFVCKILRKKTGSLLALDIFASLYEDPVESCSINNIILCCLYCSRLSPSGLV